MPDLKQFNVVRFDKTIELSKMREKAKEEGNKKLYDNRWRDRDPADAPDGIKPVIRLKSPLHGKTVVSDLIHGDLSVYNNEIDDMILLRSDGTPTYMLAVVADDHDMEISHVIRGDDHLTNTFRQIQVYNALCWEGPTYAHLPLLHGSDGTKMSKRHGALGVGAYREFGFLPEAMNNYLLRLGWAHGDEEIISQEQAIEWFDIGDVGRSPAKFDLDKLTSLNSHYIRKTDNARLVTLIIPILRNKFQGKLAVGTYDRLMNGMTGLKERAKSIIELAENAEFYALCRPIPLNAKASKVLDESSIRALKKIRQKLIETPDWSSTSLEVTLNKFSADANIKLREIAPPLRASLTGKTVSPGIFEVLVTLGKEQSLGRIDDVLTSA